MIDIEDVAREIKRTKESCNNFQGPLEKSATTEAIELISKTIAMMEERIRTLGWVLGVTEVLPQIEEEYTEAIKARETELGHR